MLQIYIYYSTFHILRLAITCGMLFARRAFGLRLRPPRSMSRAQRKNAHRIPVARLHRAETLVEKPLERFVQMRQHAAQVVALVGVHLVAESDALLDQRARQHQRVLLMDERVGGAVHEEIVAAVDVAGAQRQIGRLHGAQPLRAGRHVAIGEERACARVIGMMVLA